MPGSPNRNKSSRGSAHLELHRILIVGQIDSVSCRSSRAPAVGSSSTTERAEWTGGTPYRGNCYELTCGSPDGGRGATIRRTDESAPEELPTGPFELRGNLTRLVIYNEPSEQGDQSDAIEWTVSEDGISLHLSFWWPGSRGLAVRDASFYERRSETRRPAQG